MRIAFIVGSADVGRDGVGDHARRLARGCAAAGHDCLLLALRERGDGSRELEHGRGHGVDEIPYRERLPWGHVERKAGAELAAFRPDWISLQYVCWAFGRHGIARGLGARLRRMTPRGARWHVMFHELWLGLGKGASLKHRLLGLVQRHHALATVRALRPAAVHTHATPYAHFLGRRRIRAGQLEVIGGVTPQDRDASAALPYAFIEQGASGFDRARLWIGGVFGWVHPEWSEQPLLNALAGAAAPEHRRPALVFIGRSGRSPSWFAEARARVRSRADIVALGERSAVEVSRVLNSLDFGVSTTPWALIEKSASTATLREHGLPVLVTRDDVRFGRRVPIPAPRDGYWIVTGARAPGPAEVARHRGAPRSVAADAAARFVAELERCG